MADAALAVATSALGVVTGAISKGIGAIVALAMTLPFAPTVGVLYLKYFGTTPVHKFVIEVVPVLYVSLLPLISMLFAVCNLCRGSSRAPLGNRVMRRVQLAVYAGGSMYKSVSSKKLKSLSPGDLERGAKGSPVKNKAADLAQEKAIKSAAAKNKPRR